MNEATYQLDIAAEMLGCQQKKILTEWAKDTISVVIDLGDETEGNTANLSVDLSNQPRRDEFFNRFPGESFNPFQLLAENRRLTRDERKRNDELMDESQRELLCWYGQSGFNIPHRMRDEATNKNNKDRNIIKTRAYIFGLWRVSYTDYSRQQVQRSFTLTPYPKNASSENLTATFEAPSNSNTPTLAKKNLRLTESSVAIMRQLLANRPGRQQARPAQEELPEQPKSHGGIERFALERERILAAALYVAHHFPKEAGKTFKSHAGCIDKHSYLFWKDEPAPDPERVAKILSDATRTPDEWKILGGNAKPKR